MNKKIIELLSEIRPYEKITETSELIENGILDSLAIISLIAQLEDAFEIEIADEAVTASNFANVDSIVQLVIRSKTA